MFVVLGALALKLKLAGGYIGDLRADGGGLFVYFGKLPFLFRLTRVQLVYALGVRVDKGAARLAVAGEALQQRLELRAGAVRRAGIL